MKTHLGSSDSTPVAPQSLSGLSVEATVAEPVRHFQRYSHDDRANRAASHRLGYRAKQRVGEFFWTHPDVPGRAFASRKAALRAAGVQP